MIDKIGLESDLTKKDQHLTTVITNCNSWTAKLAQMSIYCQQKIKKITFDAL
jgi:hypothetical protein